MLNLSLLFSSIALMSGTTGLVDNNVNNQNQVVNVDINNSSLNWDNLIFVENQNEINITTLKENNENNLLMNKQFGFDNNELSINSNDIELNVNNSIETTLSTSNIRYHWYRGQRITLNSSTSYNVSIYSVNLSISEFANYTKYNFVNLSGESIDNVNIYFAINNGENINWGIALLPLWIILGVIATGLLIFSSIKLWDYISYRKN